MSPASCSPQSGFSAEAIEVCIEVWLVASAHALLRCGHGDGAPPAAAGAIVAAIARSEAGVVTKADLAGFATREDLARSEIRGLLIAFAVAGLLFAALRFSG